MLIIDVSMLVRRTHAKMDFLKTETGIPTGMEFGTLRTLEMLQKKYPDQEIVLCFDSPKNFKRERYPGYKANRKSPGDKFYKRLNKFKKFLRCLYASMEEEGHEADELMYSVSMLTAGTHFIYTNDHDLLQAVNERDTMLKSFHSKLFTWDVDKIYAEFGLTPELLPIFWAFTGDKVDNIVGVPRIPKTFLAELIMWADEMKMPLYTMLHEIVVADWKPKMKLAIQEFYNSGQWQRNYDLIKLKAIPYSFVVPTKDNVYVESMLKLWQIKSLNVCKQFNFIENAEF